MSIEANLKSIAESNKRIADALEALSGTIQHEADAPVVTEAPTPIRPADVVSPALPQLDLVEVNTELGKIAQGMGDGGAAIRQIINDLGISQLGEASNDELHAILNAARTARGAL